MKHIIPCLVIVVLTLSFAAVADDEQVYESLSDVTIDRVFFTTAERVRLDALRKSKSTAILTARTNRSERSSSTNAAGFFVDEQGNVRVYHNGEFVVASQTTEIDFKDAIKLIRHDPDSAEDVGNEDE